MRREFAVTILACCFASMSVPLVAGENGDTNDVIPLIVMERVPLRNAISVLAVRAGINCVLDPRIGRSIHGADGRTFDAATVDLRWEKLTARQALDRMLSQYRLALVENPATSVARIVPTNEVTRLASTKSEHRTTDKVLAEIRMDDVPLEDAIRRLAADAHLNIILDPRLSDPTYGAPGRFLAKWPISFHFRNVTASQALRALLDNYGLMLTEESGVSQLITPAEPAPEKIKPHSAD